MLMILLVVLYAVGVVVDCVDAVGGDVVFTSRVVVGALMLQMPRKMRFTTTA